MLGFVYLFVSFLLGFLLVAVFLPAIKGLVKLAASFLIGLLVVSWLTFLFTLLFSSTTDPLRGGILSTFFILLVLLFFFKGRLKRANTKLEINSAELVFLIFALVLSFWMMGKSFSYDNRHFRIASNIFDDFNIHLGIIRSFSLGKNFPPELPFFAGQPLRYHFLTNFSFAIFESLGWNLNWAVNIPSALAFTSLLILIYSLGKRIFANALVGFLAVVLFLFNSSLTFIKFFQKFGLSLSTPLQIWRLGKYISAGPFDKGIISIFWNLNTFVNQRHLIFTSGLFLLIIYLLLETKRKDNIVLILLAGVLTGLMPLWHGLVFLAALIVGALFQLLQVPMKSGRSSAAGGIGKQANETFRLRRNLLLKNQRNPPVSVLGEVSLVGLKRIFFFLFPALILSLLQFLFLSAETTRLPLFRIGFLLAENLSLANLIKYWGLNLGLSLLTITAGLWIASSKQRKLFLPFFSLFLIANLFQLTPNMFHNHSLLNLWIIIFNFYSALFLVWVFKKGLKGKILAGILLFLLTFSGALDLMVIKNDFIHQIADQPQDRLATWIAQNTATSDVFLAPPELMYSPVQLGGRKSFLAASHFVWGYGYDIDPRKILTNKIYNEDNKEEIVNLVRKTEADYWLTTDKDFDFPKAYEDEKWALYKIKN